MRHLHRMPFPAARGLIMVMIILLGTLTIPGPVSMAADPGDDRNDGSPFFQLTCTPSHTNQDNIFNWPRGQATTHEHLFFGATIARTGVTAEEMRRAKTTCTDRRDTAGYWVPTLYDERGNLRMPRRIRVYYARRGDPKALHAFPAGLQMTAGDPFAQAPQPRGVVDWVCRKRKNQSAGYPPQSIDPPRCRDDEFLAVSIRFPDCWDGKHLTSADNRSHVAYSDRQGVCPASHPVPIPRMRYSITYEADGGYTGGEFTLGGRRGAPNTLTWHGMHGHFWNTWDQARLERYVQGCLINGQHTGGVACRR